MSPRAITPSALTGKTAQRTLNLNGLGSRTVTIAPADLTLQATMAKDGAALADALTKKVHALAADQTHAEFSARVDSGQFTLKPGGAAWQTAIPVKPTAGVPVICWLCWGRTWHPVPR